MAVNNAGCAMLTNYLYSLQPNRYCDMLMLRYSPNYSGKGYDCCWGSPAAQMAPQDEVNKQLYTFYDNTNTTAFLFNTS